jgi:long-chain acyl-CoA synthetase
VHLVAVVMGTGETEAVLAAGRAVFGPLKAPRAVHWMRDWPMLPSGKTDLAALERVMGWR